MINVYRYVKRIGVNCDSVVIWYSFDCLTTGLNKQKAANLIFSFHMKKLINIYHPNMGDLNPILPTVQVAGY
jgi:hypothetical protein